MTENKSSQMGGLNPMTIQKIVGVFASYPNIDKVILYGSRAKGTHKSSSDIDLTIVGNKMTLTDLLKLENELDDLLLPYKIDLSLFHQIQDKEVINHIHRVGLAFYEKA